MNNIYRVIYNKSTKTFQAVCEYARAQGKGSLRTKIFRPVWRLSLLVIALGLAGVAQAQIESTTRLDNNTLIIDGKGIDWYTQSMADRVLIGKSVNGESKVTAVGDSITTNGKGSTTIGSNIRSNGNQATALGVEVKTYGDNSTAIASNAVANGENSIAIGSNAQTGGTKIFKGNPVADEAKPAVNAIAIGAVSKVEKENAIGLGANTQANQVGAVAIGSGSVADRAGLAKGTTATITPTITPNVSGVYSPIENDAEVVATIKGTGNGAVSVGSATATRQIINVAAGSLDTDAVNVAQLKAVAKLASPAKYFADKDTDTAEATQATEKAKAKTMTDGVLGIKGKDTTAQIDNKTEKKDTEAKTRTDTKNIVTTIDTANNTVSVELSSHIKGLSSLQFDDAQGIKIGDKDTSAEGNSVAIGKGATVTNGSNPGIGFRQNPNFSTDHNTVAPTQASQNIKVFQSVNGVALGDKATAGKGATAIGGYAQAKGTYAVGVGSAVSAKGYNSIAVGQGAQATGNSTLSMGRESVASGSYATAIGNVASATGDGSFAVGHSAQATGKRTIAIGAVATDNSSTNGVHNANGTRATADDAIAMGALNYVNGVKSVAIGRGNNVQQANTFVLGSDVTTSQGNSVVLGAGSTDREATAETQAVVNGITYGGFKGVGKVDSGVVSVGATDKERQIINVATGKISATSTDAINGSQLYLTQEALGNLANTTANNFGGGVIVNPNGSLTAPRYSITTADGANTTIINNVGDALTALNTEIQKPITFAGDKGTNVERNLGETLNVKGNATGDLTDGNIGVEADGTDTLNIKLAKDVDLGKDGSLTIGDTKVNNSGLTITNGPSVTKTGINAGDKKITNVSPATLSADSKDAVNGSQLYTTNQNVETNATNIKTNADNIAKGFNITADNLGAGITDKDNVQLGDTVKYTSTDKNIVATVTDNQIDFGLANKVTIGQDKPVVIDGTTGTITGLTNTTFDPASTYTGGQAATQEQLTQVYNKAKTEVKGTGLATVAAPTKGDNGQDVYIVDVAKANAPTVTRGNVTIAAGDENKVMTAGDVANAITNSEKTSSVKAGTGVTVVVGTEDDKGNTAYTVAVNAQNIAETAQIPVVYTNAAGDKLYKQEDGTFNTVADGSGTTVQPADVIASMQNGAGDTTTPTTLANVASNLPTTYNTDAYNTVGNAVTTSQILPTGLNVSNAATVGDVLNAGFNLQGNGKAKDFVKPYDTVNFINGKGTTAVVTTAADGKSSEVKYDVNVDNASIVIENGVLKATAQAPQTTTLKDANNDGKIDAPITADADKFVKAGDIVNAINNSGFTLKTSANGGTKDLGNDEVINPGDVIDMVAGKNLTVKQDVNGKVTYALADDIAVNQITSNNVAINPNGTLTVGANSTVNMGGNKITNVAVGTAPTDAVNVSQLTQAVAGSKENVVSTNKTVSVTPTVAQDGSTTFDLAVNVGSGLTVNSNTGAIDVKTDGITINTTPTGEFKVNTTPLTSNANGMVNTPANPNAIATAGDVANAINNSGWNLQNNGEQRDLIKPSDKVDFINGTGTTAVVTTAADGKSSTVTYNVNADNKTTKITYVDVSGNPVYAITDAQGNVSYNTAQDGSGTAVAPSMVTSQISAIIPTTNINHIVGGTDINGNVVDGNSSAVTTVIDPKKDPNDPSNQQPITLRADEALRTYDAAGVGTVETNSVLTAIKNINEQGTKYIHFNGGERSVGGVRGGDDDQSQANGAKSTAIGFRTTADGDASVSVGNEAHALGAQSIAIGDKAQAAGAQSIAIGTGNVVTGSHSGAIGDPNTVTGSASYVLGNNNNVGTNNTFVVGNNVVATAENSVALGNNTAITQATGKTLNTDGSQGVSATTAGATGTVETATVGHMTYGGFEGATANGAVSVGASGSERRIQNVAAGEISRTSTDAINGSQLHAVTEGLGNRINHINARIDDVEDDANAGVSSAMAMATLPQAYLPGKSMLTGGIASYNGEGAVAVGFSKLSDNGRWVLKMSGSADTQGNVGGAVGAGFHF
ncbi:YadA-like family protein [Moraxella bovis]|uniref:YadA-like family protein n=1 Tax=Moraxella bovis TaxID=476 RepID=UPI0022263673|nr:YadA-like family protein [Moraxella bovis]UZA42282.1 YadA-like family protein [Moraxella bovis]